jgi:hypothetical protein
MLTLALYLTRFLAIQVKDESQKDGTIISTQLVDNREKDSTKSHFLDDRRNNKTDSNLVNDFHRIVYRLVKANHRTAQGNSLLHLCFPLCELGRWTDSGQHWHRAPTTALLDTLLECGAEADAVNHKGESPLFHLLRPADCESRCVLKHPQRAEWVAMLLRHGAHADRVTWTAERQDVMTLLRDVDLSLLRNPLQYVSLQCLASRVIRTCRLRYADPSLLPPHLVHFVHIH